MKLELNNFETNCLLEAVHQYLMNIRDLEADASENYNAIVVINKFLLTAHTLEMIDNLPF